MDKLPPIKPGVGATVEACLSLFFRDVKEAGHDEFVCGDDSMDVAAVELAANLELQSLRRDAESWRRVRSAYRRNNGAVIRETMDEVCRIIIEEESKA